MIEMAETEKEFGERISETVETCYMGIALYVGHKLQLFDVLYEVAPCQEAKKTSQEVAAAANLKERYVREWLCSMVVGKIVAVDECGSGFWLPEHRYKTLTSKAPTPLTMMHPFPLLTRPIDTTLECFKIDGPRGLPYSAFEDFHSMMETFGQSSFKTHILPDFVPSIPGLKTSLETGIKVLDIGCGTGHAMRILAQAFPNSEFTGIDFSADAVSFGNSRAEKLTNLHFEVMDATSLNADWANRFDFVVSFDAVHDQAYPDKSLKETFRVLKPGGTYCMVEPEGTGNVFEDLQQNIPYKSFKYTASMLHCIPVSMYFDGGMGVGTMWGKKKATEMLEEAGFVDLEFNRSFSPFNANILARKPQQQESASKV